MIENAFVIPITASRHNLIALGKTRSGKSSKLRVMTEYLLEGGSPVCILDPKGDWWGLKSSADGKRAGFPIVIFGGEHADVPINEHSGAHVAEIIATGNRPALIDLGGWMVGARTRFFVDFAATFFRLARGARHLVIDEVHNFAPQGRVMDPDAGKMLHWANRLASEGSGKGVTLFAASQRPQKVHKDFVTSCETLIACKVIHKLDRDAIKDWIDGCADATKGREVIADLAQLKKPEAWAWCPEVDYGPERVTFPMFRTYDSFKPQPADLGKLKGWADVDLEDVKAKLATVVKEAEANDPKKLKARIAEIERQVANPPKPIAANIAVVDEARIARLEADNRALEQHRDDLAAYSEQLRDAVASARNALVDIRDRAEDRLGKWMPIEPLPIMKPSAPAPSAGLQRTALPRAPVATSAPRTSKANGAKAPPPDGEPITGPQQKILDAIAFLESLGNAEPDNASVAFVAGYSSSTGGGFVNPRGRLNVRGLIVYTNDRMRLTDAGRACANLDAAVSSNEELHARILGQLQGPHAKLLRALLDAYPRSLTNEELAEATGYESPTGGGFVNPRGRLNALGLITYRAGVARASDNLFPLGR